MANPKIKDIVEKLYNGESDIREALSDAISEKAVEALEEKKQDVAKNFFAQGE